MSFIEGSLGDLKQENADYIERSSLPAWIPWTALGVAVGVCAVAGWWYRSPDQEEGKRKGEAPEFPSHESERPQVHDAQAEQMYEQYLAQMLTKINEFIATDQVDAAERVGLKCLELAKEIWGTSSVQYALVHIPVSTVYEKKLTKTGDKSYSKKYQSTLETASKLMEQLDDKSFADHRGMIYDRLLAFYTQQNDYETGEKYAISYYNMRKALWLEKPSVPALFEKMASASFTVCMMKSNLGRFKDAESLYRETLNHYYKKGAAQESAWTIIEYFTNCLHQQGKTDQALEELNEYKKHVQNVKDAAKWVSKVYARQATLLFTIDKFEETEKLIEMAIDSERKTGKLTAQNLCDLAAVFWELNKEDKAKEAQDELKQMPLDLNNELPLTRSQFLYTIDAKIINGICVLLVRINRTRPNRKEGEKLENPEDVPRKLQKCFLEVYFETTKDVVNLSLPVSMASFTIESPKLEVETGKWYEVTIVIYDDENKSNKLGVHHQMVYSFPFQGNYNW